MEVIMYITDERKQMKVDSNGERHVIIGRYPMRKVRMWLHIMTDFDSGQSKEDLSIAFTKAWVKDKPYGLEIVSFPHGHSITVCPDLIGVSNGEMACLNLYKKEGKYVLKITPAEFKSNKSGVYWTEFTDKDILTLEQKGGDNMDRNYINSYGDSYDDFVRDCLDDGQKPWSYDEWASYWKERDSYEQDQIDLSLMTDEERYGD